MIELIASCILLACCVLVLLGTYFVLREQVKLFNLIRKMAAMYPPYIQPDNPDEEVVEKAGKTSVIINPDWDESLDGRD